MTTYTVSVQPGRGQPLQELGLYDAPDGQAAIKAAESQYPGQPESARWWAVCYYEQRSNDDDNDKNSR